MRILKSALVVFALTVSTAGLGRAAETNLAKFGSPLLQAARRAALGPQARATSETARLLDTLLTSCSLAAAANGPEPDGDEAQALQTLVFYGIAARVAAGEGMTAATSHTLEALAAAKPGRGQLAALRRMTALGMSGLGSPFGGAVDRKGMDEARKAVRLALPPETLDLAARTSVNAEEKARREKERKQKDALLAGALLNVDGGKKLTAPQKAKLQAIVDGKE